MLKKTGALSGEAAIGEQREARRGRDRGSRSPAVRHSMLVDRARFFRI